MSKFTSNVRGDGPSRLAILLAAAITVLVSVFILSA